MPNRIRRYTKTEQRQIIAADTLAKQIALAELLGRSTAAITAKHYALIKTHKTRGKAAKAKTTSKTLTQGAKLTINLARKPLPEIIDIINLLNKHGIKYAA